MNLALPERRCATCRYWTQLSGNSGWGDCAVTHAYLLLGATAEETTQALGTHWAGTDLYMLAHDSLLSSLAVCEHGYEPRTS